MVSYRPLMKGWKKPVNSKLVWKDERGASSERREQVSCNDLERFLDFLPLLTIFIRR